ncbi:SH2 domain-containing protein 3C-like [Dryobates pubescens]|uniref:SH2 domain-containing protein 3C-like n=1 Tax=Dryobates pubescens TaxID=118200 RepID=UPI0023BA05B8|nr:SH2 domain-containing protein 3C-like [Dryobates pubescens]
MAEGQKRGGFKKFRFFKFKGFGSLSSIPRSFTLRRVSVAPSSSKSLVPGFPPSRAFLEEPFDSTQDDLNTMPKSPGPYARSSAMYSHMGTMPRLNLGKAGKSLGKAKSSQSLQGKGTPSNKTPQKALLPSPESPEMPGTPDPGIDSPTTTGQEEQDEEAQLMDTPAEVATRIDQKPAGNVSGPGTQGLSSSLAPNPSQTSIADKAVGVVTIERHLPEKGQEHPSKSSLARYAVVGFALPSAMTPFLPPPRARNEEEFLPAVGDGLCRPHIPDGCEGRAGGGLGREGGGFATALRL